VAFDEDLDDALFAMPDGAQASRHPAHGDGPPDAALGVPVGRPVIVARAPSLVIAVDRVVAYPTGFELGLTVRTQEQPVHGSFDQSHRRTWSGTSAFPGESLRVEVVAGAPVALRAISGSGTQTRFDQRYWVAPLPPPGPVGIVVAWPRRGLAETRADLDGAAIAEAGGRAEELWP
jgi:hypothetical protein